MEMKQDRNEEVIQYKQKLGLLMFLIYVTAYSGFVFISVFNVELMDIVMIFGLNLAVFYGLGIIVFALILAVIYSVLCKRKERLLLGSPKEESGKGKGV